MTTLGLALAGARRAWYVPGIRVSGDLHAATVEMLASESDDTYRRVVLYHYAIGGSAQEITFSMLVDHRGNALPDTLVHPVVILIPRNDVHVAVVGRPSSTGCRLARTDYSAHDGLVDLWVVESGREGELSS